MKSLLVVTLFIMSLSVFALEIDEKLTLRIVSTSVSKKTILINRGIEDGLKQGDHAKFYVSDGVVARAVCIKLSPTRSVWSIYRVVAGAFIKDEQVMKLKITPPVKITKDDSRMLVKEDVGAFVSKDPRDLGIPLAEGAEDLNQIEQANPNDTSNAFINTSLREKNREIFGMFHYSSTEDRTVPSNNGTEFTSSVDDLLIRVGGEYYFKDESKWYSRISLLGMFVLDRRTLMAYQGATVNEKSSEFGFGGSIYINEMPSSVHKLIYYVNYVFALGSTTSTYTPGDEDRGQDSFVLDASTLSNTFGLGAKFYASAGLGMRAEFQYKFHGDSYAADEGNNKWTKTRVGPKLLVGLSYRF